MADQLPADLAAALASPDLYLTADQLALDRIRAWTGLDVKPYLWLMPPQDTPPAPPSRSRLP